MSRGVNDIHSVVIPDASSSSRGDGDSSFLFLLHPVHGCCTLVHLPNLVALTGVVKNTFCSRGLGMHSCFSENFQMFQSYPGYFTKYDEHCLASLTNQNERLRNLCTSILVTTTTTTICPTLPASMCAMIPIFLYFSKGKDLPSDPSAQQKDTLRVAMSLNTPIPQIAPCRSLK